MAEPTAICRPGPDRILWTFVWRQNSHARPGGAESLCLVHLLRRLQRMGAEERERRPEPELHVYPGIRNARMEPRSHFQLCRDGGPDCPPPFHGGARAQ